MWKSRRGILVNIVPREFQGQKPEGPQAPRVFGLGFYNIDSVNTSILGRDLERMQCTSYSPHMCRTVGKVQSQHTWNMFHKM